MSTNAIHRFGDDDSFFDSEVAGETSALMDRIMKQFNRLQLKAASIGVYSVIVVHAHDPLSGYSFRRCRRVGDHFANLGAMSVSLDELKEDLRPED